MGTQWGRSSAYKLQFNQLPLIKGSASHVTFYGSKKLWLKPASGISSELAAPVHDRLLRSPTSLGVQPRKDSHEIATNVNTCISERLFNGLIDSISEAPVSWVEPRCFGTAVFVEGKGPRPMHRRDYTKPEHHGHRGSTLVPALIQHQAMRLNEVLETHLRVTCTFDGHVAHSFHVVLLVLNRHGELCKQSLNGRDCE
jgi:hypothetical protein